MGIERLLEKASAYIKEPDLLRIQEAYEFAEQAHHGQVRKSGEPYILHPLAVADIVVNMQMDTLSIIARCFMMSLRIQLYRSSRSVSASGIPAHCWWMV